jgi:hypothetical protein
MRLCALVVTALASLLLATARADVPPPDAEPCLGKKAGDGCTFQAKGGTCTTKTCTRSTPSGSSAYDCLLCVPGSEDGGCNVGAARPLAPWVLAGGLAVVVLRIRRRR